MAKISEVNSRVEEPDTSEEEMNTQEENTQNERGTRAGPRRSSLFPERTFENFDYMNRENWPQLRATLSVPVVQQDFENKLAQNISENISNP